jgi:hypothetical protein
MDPVPSVKTDASVNGMRKFALLDPTAEVEKLKNFIPLTVMAVLNKLVIVLSKPFQDGRICFRYG